MKITDEMVEAATGAIVLGEDARGNPVHLSPREARLVLTAALVDVPAVESEPVAWLDDGTCRAGSDRTAHRVITDEQKRDMPSAISASFTTPLYAHPPRSLSNEGSEVIAAAQRYVDAVSHDPGARASDKAWRSHDKEKQDAFDALRAALSTRKGSSEGGGSSTSTKGCAE